MGFTRVERSDTPVHFLRADDTLDGIRRAWARLEEIVGDLRGRRFRGSFDAGSGEYRACVLVTGGEEPAAGLEAGTLPGGAYLRARLRGEAPAVYDLIPPTFDALVAAGDVDGSRPSLELYRRRDEIDLLLPVRRAG